MRYPLVSALFVAILAIATVGTLPALARTRHCRKCQVEVWFSDYFVAVELNNLMDWLTPKIAGGDGYSWDTAPYDAGKGAWKGIANFPRLCGNGPTVSQTNVWEFWKGHNTSVGLGLPNGGLKTCGKNVRCADHSHCEHSILTKW